MALMSQGIVGGEMAWPLVMTGMALAATLILINAPSPMLIAVGMYLPFPSTAAIFVGGLMAWWLTRSLDERQATDVERTRATNTGVLLSSGFIAGEALMAVLLAFVVGASEAFGWLALPQIADSAIVGTLMFVLLFYMLIKMPLNAMRSGAPGGENRVMSEAADFWSARPSRRFEWREAHDGRCVVLRPKLGGSRVGRWLAARLSDPYYRIRLDDLGTFVWKACDGQTPLTVIAERMRDEFGGRVEPAEQRLGLFVQQMLRSRLLDVHGAR